MFRFLIGEVSDDETGRLSLPFPNRWGDTI